MLAQPVLNGRVLIGMPISSNCRLCHFLLQPTISTSQNQYVHMGGSYTSEGSSEMTADATDAYEQKHVCYRSFLCAERKNHL